MTGSKIRQETASARLQSVDQEKSTIQAHRLVISNGWSCKRFTDKGPRLCVGNWSRRVFDGLPSDSFLIARDSVEERSQVINR